MVPQDRRNPFDSWNQRKILGCLPIQGPIGSDPGINGYAKLLLQLSEEGEEVEEEEEEEEDGCGGGGFYRHTGNQTIEIQQHLVY
ncbi:hypothetical protein OUZ56_033680 [Daphnia magna]|uniref:Uncharacterized protein n=1 Tax=Daphnia magna TaxID=35525 RepID=A0ABR0BAZ9_9CRUS|nr:hypothetical protein OUZ56_033680 [Daphnia magna]